MFACRTMTRFRAHPWAMAMLSPRYDIRNGRVGLLGPPWGSLSVSRFSVLLPIPANGRPIVQLGIGARLCKLDHVARDGMHFSARPRHAMPRCQAVHPSAWFALHEFLIFIPLICIPLCFCRSFFHSHFRLSFPIALRSLSSLLSPSPLFSLFFPCSSSLTPQFYFHRPPSAVHLPPFHSLFPQLTYRKRNSRPSFSKYEEHAPILKEIWTNCGNDERRLSALRLSLPPLLTHYFLHRLPRPKQLHPHDDHYIDNNISPLSKAGHLSHLQPTFSFPLWEMQDN